jgi:hypothetical protein
MTLWVVGVVSQVARQSVAAALAASLFAWMERFISPIRRAVIDDGE